MPFIVDYEKIYLGGMLYMALNNNFQNIDLSQLKEWVLVDKIPVLYKEREQTQQYIYCKSGYTVYYSDSFSYITGVPAPRNSDAYYGDTSTKLNFLLKDYTAAQFSTEADFLNTLRGKYFAYSYSNSYGYCANTIYNFMSHILIIKNIKLFSLTKDL